LESGRLRFISLGSCGGFGEGKRAPKLVYESAGNKPIFRTRDDFYRDRATAARVRFFGDLVVRRKGRPDFLLRVARADVSMSRAGGEGATRSGPMHRRTRREGTAFGRKLSRLRIKRADENEPTRPERKLKRRSALWNSFYFPPAGLRLSGGGQIKIA
jgi:hypothetical protein